MSESHTKQTEKSRTFEEQLDALIDAAEKEGRGKIEVHQGFEERRRKRAHAKAKAKQPVLGIRGTSHNDPLDPEPLPAPSGCVCHDCLLGKLKAFWEAPINEDDKDGSTGAMEYLLLTIQDTLDAADAEDLIFALMRIGRKALAWNPHLWRAQDIPKPSLEPESATAPDTAK